MPMRNTRVITARRVEGMSNHLVFQDDISLARMPGRINEFRELFPEHCKQLERCGEVDMLIVMPTTGGDQCKPAA